MTGGDADDDVAAVAAVGGHLDGPKVLMIGMLAATTMSRLITIMAETSAVGTASLVEGDLHLTLEDS